MSENEWIEETPIPDFVVPSSYSRRRRVGEPYKQISVLLVDDDSQSRQRVRRMLAKSTDVLFDVDCVRQRASWLDRLVLAKTQILLLGLASQDSTGVERVRELHALAPDLPVIVLLEDYDQALMARLGREGVYDCLVKRFLEANLLVRSVRFVLERARRRRAEQSFAQLQRESTQNERLRALGQMANAVAHDFNNCLTPILSYSDVLLDDPRLPHHTRERLRLINSCASDAAEVVQQLQAFSRPPSHGQELENVDLRNLVEEIPALTRPKWRDEAQKTGRLIEVELEMNDAPQTPGNISELRVLLTNLMFNAADAIPSMGRITLRLCTQSPFAVIAVIDTGVGMTEEVRQCCFEPLYTTKGEHGSGLGLSVCHGIVQRHHGRIEIDSIPGQGTTVRIYLPLPRPRNL